MAMLGIAGLVVACGASPSAPEGPITQVVVATLTDTPSPTATEALPATPTPSPTPTITPTPAPGEPLYVETFDDNSREWETYAASDVVSEISGGAYRLTLLAEAFFQWASLPRQFDDVQIAVQVRPETGSGAHMSGVICRLQDGDNFYLFSISSDGFYRVMKWVDGEDQVLVPWSPSSAIVGGGLNELEVACLGNQLALWVNGTLVANVADNSLQSGSIAVVGGSYAGRQPVTLLFEQVAVLRPNYDGLPPLPTATPDN